MHHLTPTSPEPKHGLGWVLRRVKDAPTATAAEDYAWLGEEMEGRLCAHCRETLLRFEVMNRQARCTVCELKLAPRPPSEADQAAERSAARLSSCGVPPAYRHYTADSWKGSMPPEFATFTNNPAGFWYLYGEPGRGKTHLAVATMDRLVLSRPGAIWPLFRDVPTLLSEAKRQLGAADDQIRTMRECQVLVFDDLGAERGTDYEQSLIGEVLRYRHMHEKATVVTTNLSPDDLRAIEPRIASRVTNGLVTRLGGRDRRSPK